MEEIPRSRVRQDPQARTARALLGGSLQPRGLSLVLDASPLGAIAEACHNLRDDFEAAGVAYHRADLPVARDAHRFLRRVAPPGGRPARPRPRRGSARLPRQRPTPSSSPVVERQEGPDWIGFRVGSEVFEDLARDFAGVDSARRRSPQDGSTPEPRVRPAHQRQTTHADRQALQGRAAANARTGRSPSGSGTKRTPGRASHRRPSASADVSRLVS